MPVREIVAFAMIAVIAVLLAYLWMHLTRDRRAYRRAIRDNRRMRDSGRSDD